MASSLLWSMFRTCLLTNFPKDSLDVINELCGITTLENSNLFKQTIESNTLVQTTKHFMQWGELAILNIQHQKVNNLPKPPKMAPNSSVKVSPLKSLNNDLLKLQVDDHLPILRTWRFFLCILRRFAFDLFIGLRFVGYSYSKSPASWNTSTNYLLDYFDSLYSDSYYPRSPSLNSSDANYSF